MENFPLVKVEQGECHLDQVVQDLLLCEVFALRILDLGVHITTLAMDHDNIEELLSVNEGVLISNNVCVPNFL